MVLDGEPDKTVRGGEECRLEKRIGEKLTFSFSGGRDEK